MSTARWIWLAAAALTLMVLLLVRYRAQPDEEPLPLVAERARTTARTRPPLPGPRTGALPKISEVVSQHTADPCSPIGEATITPDFDEITRDGITIAWPHAGPDDPGPGDAALHPIALAHLVSGLLAESADFTGTATRTELTVVIYPSGDDMRARTKGHAWAQGLYDGAAVRIPYLGRGDLGISMPTLRHEVMHAQLHAAVGCMPAWFNEGLAMYFANEPTLAPWIAELRHPEALEVKTLTAGAIDAANMEVVMRLYAQSLAMVLYLADRGGETGLRAAIEAAREAEHDLWERVAPGGEERGVFDSLARRLFGLPRGPELDAVLANTICCYGTKSLGDLGCRGVAPRPGETIWTDRSSSPRATCSTRW